ncbi:pyridoxamine 5'-phosphate oxidase family protein [Kribbella sp. CWNU-51]
MTTHFSGNEPAARRAAELGSDELPPAECWRLLAAARVGRLVTTEHALPAITPNEYMLDGDSILFTTRDEAKTRAARRRELVAFAIDPGRVLQPATWLLTVIGHLCEIPPDRVDSLAAHPWHPGATNTPLILRLRIESLTGRRVNLQGPPERAP